MKLYWRPASIPELSPLPRGQRGRLWAASYPRVWGHLLPWATLLVASSGPVVVMYSVPLGILVAVFGAVLHFQVVAHYARRYIQDRLNHAHHLSS